MLRKDIPGLIVRGGYGLTDRQIRVRATNGTTDRAGDIVVPRGCVSANRSVPVLTDHVAQIENLIARANIVVTDSEVDAIVTFMPAGLSEKSDDVCAKYKAGVGTDVSIGFRPIEFEPIRGGLKYTKWELLEISLVVVGCNPDAVVTGKRFHKAGRVLSGANASKLQQAHDAAESCRALVADVLGGAGGDTDEAKAKRLRQIEILALGAPPPMSRSERMALVREIDFAFLKRCP